uniref:Ezrin-radixin-moesin-like protein n=1 Tax=Rodentolepis nana TaxID=102285 RepID=A0A0R3TG25_RODNA
LEKRMAEIEMEQSFEALTLKVQKAEEERRRREELEREIAAKRGHLQDHGTDQQLGRLSFKILYVLPL